MRISNDTTKIYIFINKTVELSKFLQSCESKIILKVPTIQDEID